MHLKGKRAALLICMAFALSAPARAQDIRASIRWARKELPAGKINDIVPVAFSPDGTVIAAGSLINNIALFDASGGKPVRTMEGPSLWSLAFSPDGTLLASAGMETGITLWSAGTGKVLSRIPYQGGFALSVAFSPDGKTFAAGGLDNAVTLFETATGKRIRSLAGHTGPVISAVFSPDGKTVASGGDDGTLRLWETATGKQLAVLEGHEGKVLSIAFSPGGRTIASAGFDKTVRLWDASAMKGITALAGHLDAVTTAAFSPDGKILASGSGDGTVALWNAFTGRMIATLRGNAGPLWSVAFGPDGKTLAAGSVDGAVVAWSLERIESGAYARPAAINASSMRAGEGDGNAFQPVKAFDGRQETGWMEGASGSGPGQWLEITFDRPVTADGMRISPGWFDAGRWRLNNRIRTLRIDLDGYVQDVEFQDRMEPQDVTLKGAKVFSRARFTVESVYKAVGDDGAGISEIEIWNAGKRVEMDLGAFQDKMQAAAGPATGQPTVKGYWNFSGNVEDAGDGHVDCRSSGKPSYGEGPFGPAFDFESGSYVNIQDPAAYNGLNAFAVEAWIYPTGYSFCNPIISKVNPNRDFVFQIEENGMLNAHFAINFDEYYMCTAVRKVPLRRWTHAAVIWTGSRWQLFQDGMMVGERDCGGKAPSWTGTLMAIGNMNEQYRFIGRLDEVKFLSGPVTPEMIRRDWAADFARISAGETVRPSAITASSMLTEKYDRNMYQPVKAFDGRPDSGWMEKAAGPGLGQWVEISFPAPVTADALVIMPGWFDARYWTRNHRIRTMRIELDGYSLNAELKDEMAAQSITLPAARTFSRARFLLMSVYPSFQDDDSCISEIELWNQGRKLILDLGGFAEQLNVIPEK